MARLGSKAPKQQVFPGDFELRKGTFKAQLQGIQIYRSDNFNDKSKDELNLGFMLLIHDPESTNEPIEGTEDVYRHTESFVRVQVDDEGNFGPGGSRAKANKILSAFRGEDIVLDEDFEWYFEGIPAGIDSWEDIPHYKEYDKGDEWMSIEDININGEGVVGRRAMVQFGHAEKPSGGYSDKITIIQAMALPVSERNAALKEGEKRAEKKAPAKKAKAASASPTTPPPPKDDAIPEDWPKHSAWVGNRMIEHGIDKTMWADLASFMTLGAVNEFNNLADMERDQALAWKGIYDDAVEAGEIREVLEEALEGVESMRAKKLPEAQAKAADDFDEEFPPEEDLPF